MNRDELVKDYQAKQILLSIQGEQLQKTTNVLRLCTELSLKRAFCQQNLGLDHEECISILNTEITCLGSLFCPDEYIQVQKCFELGSRNGEDELTMNARCVSEVNTMHRCFYAHTDRLDSLEIPAKHEKLTHDCEIPARNLQHCQIVHESDGKVPPEEVRRVCHSYQSTYNACRGKIICKGLYDAYVDECGGDIGDIEKDPYYGSRIDYSQPCNQMRLALEICFMDEEIDKLKKYGIHLY